MSYSLYSYIWPLIALVLGALQITAAVLLLPERGSGPWMMLIGGGMTVTVHIAEPLLARLQSSSNPYSAIYALTSFATLGSLLFGVGLLLHALQRRAQGNRIAELEAILAAHLGE
jgi:hypothetical protein